MKRFFETCFYIYITDSELPVNATTGKRYRGINIPLLWGAADDRGFTTHEYATFKQWADRKEFVRKGEKGNLGAATFDWTLS